MDQIQNSILQMMQAVTTRPAAAPAERKPSDKDDFRKLMDEQQAANAPAEKTDAPQDGEALEVMEDPKLREQMMLAAAAMLQNPVVTQVQIPAEMVEQTPQTEVQPAAEFTAQPAQTVVETSDSLAQTVLPKVSADGTLVVRQGPVETAEAPVEAPAEPQKSVEPVQVAESGGEFQESESEENLESGAETVVFQDVREIPVKVGETPVLEEPTEAQPVETQIGEKLTEALKTGETRVEIQLTPENLGKVTIEVTMDQDGGLHVALHAENSQTRGILERDLSGLQSLLARNTQQEVQVEVPHQQASRNFYDGHQGQEHQNPQQQQQRRERRENTEDFLHQLRLGLIPVDGE